MWRTATATSGTAAGEHVLHLSAGVGAQLADAKRVVVFPSGATGPRSAGVGVAAVTAAGVVRCWPDVGASRKRCVTASLRLDASQGEVITCLVQVEEHGFLAGASHGSIFHIRLSTAPGAAPAALKSKCVINSSSSRHASGSDAPRTSSRGPPSTPSSGGGVFSRVGRLLSMGFGLSGFDDDSDSDGDDDDDDDDDSTAQDLNDSGLALGEEGGSRHRLVLPSGYVLAIVCGATTGHGQR